MMENTLIRIALYAGGIYLFLNLFALFISDKILFQPQAASYTRLPSEVKIATADGERINAVWLEPPGAKQTLLFSHGNAEDLGRVLPFIEQFHALGYSVLMYDYRGYGTSEGRPSYRKIHLDADAAYRWLVEEKKLPPQSIIAHGRSLGGAVAIWTAARHDVGGLIVESSFASAFRVKTVVPLLPWDKFNSVKAMKQVRCPVLVMHGTNDTVLPFWHGKALFNAAPEPKQHFWIENGEHNNYAYVAEQAYFDSIQAFLATL